jgi:predicted adenylyl cyclase CyaB
MPLINVEIKAYCINPVFIREYLIHNGADFKGTDFQTDTYFKVPKGRLKLREGNIENNLIYYDRNNDAGPRLSNFQLVKIPDAEGLKKILSDSLGVKIAVRKKREIYYIKNVKFHIDEVEELGSFVEIEAGNMIADKTQEELREQCDFYVKEFGIEEKDFIAGSYSDMMLETVV